MNDLENRAKKEAIKTTRDTVLVFGAIMTSTGLVHYLPFQEPLYLVLGGIGIVCIGKRIK